MLITLKAMSVLLSYPQAELQEGARDLQAALQEDGQLGPDAMQALAPLFDSLATGDIYALQEAYVELFDRSRSLSLNLFEHVHGESRARGGAMVDLVETYRAGGFEPATSELPDHLPVLLEFLALRPKSEAQEVLCNTAHILEALRVRLEKRESAYAAVFTALLQFSAAKADDKAVAELLAREEDDPNDLEALDAVWEEAQVSFAPDPNAGCPQVRDMLTQMDTPVNPAPGAAPAAAE